MKTERLNNLKNDLSENTIKRTIHLQDSNSDEEFIQPKKILKSPRSPRSPKTVNSKARVSSKTLGAQKMLSSKYTIEEVKKDKSSSDMEDTEPLSLPVNKVKQNMHHNEKNVFMK